MSQIASTTKPDLLHSDTEKQNFGYRSLPANQQAEQSILGSLLINNELIHKIGDYLRPEHFYELVHQRIFEAILAFMDRGLMASPVTLRNHFAKDEALKDVGGAEYLVRLAGNATAIINLDTYAKLVYDLALRRQLINIGEDIVNDGFDENIHDPASSQLEKAEQRLFTLASTGTSDAGFAPLKQSLSDAIAAAEMAHKRTDKLSGVPTDFRDLDELLGGLQPSDLLILAGRPSMGKTAVSINLAVNACKRLAQAAQEKGEQAPCVGFFSLEMSSQQLAARMIAMESGVDSSRMRVGTLRDDEFAQIVEANKKLYQLPFFMDDTPALSISALRTRARRLKRQSNLALLVVDYLQLLRGSSKQSESSRVQEVSEITQGLKAVAKELNIPVIALSQLSRAVEQREDKRPQLSDLRESGSIEQDADVVMFIYREEYYLSRSMPEEGSPKFEEWQQRMNRCMNVTEMIIAKQRNGPIGTARLFFNSNTTKFENLDTTHHPDDFDA